MPEPVTLGILSGVALAEGIKFLYSQAGVVLQHRRETKAEKAEADVPASEKVVTEVPAPASHVLARTWQPLAGDLQVSRSVAETVQSLRGNLREFAEGERSIDSSNASLMATTEALRLLLEAIYQQDMTFAGETRKPDPRIIRGEVDVDEVIGYAAAIRANLLPEDSQVIGSAKAKRVERGGEIVGIDLTGDGQ